MSDGALGGIRVVDLGEMVSAPYAAKLFADYGADVVKVEAPERGDRARGWGPFPGAVPDPERSGLFFFLNTNKRGVTCDVRDPRGRDLLDRLLEGADVLIENYLPPHMRALGLDYPSIAARHPNLVVVSVTPFGQTGPYAEWNGYDLNAFHLSGASSRYCGRMGEPPLEQGTFAADFYGAATAATWGLAALYGRDVAGGGQQVDVSCAEAIAATFTGGQNIGGAAQDGRFDKRTGVGMSLGAPATIMPCKDGHVWVLALEAAQWDGLARAMGNPDWMAVDIFQNMLSRAENRDMIYPLIEEWTSEHTKMEIMNACQAEGCPVTAVFTIREAAEHEHIADRGGLVTLEHDELGSIRTLGAPFQLPECPGGPTTPAPLLGEHNHTVYSELGLSRDQMTALERANVI